MGNVGEGDWNKTSNIPVVDLHKFPDVEEYKKLREASEIWGCFRLVNHKIPSALMGEMKTVVRSLLDLPMEIKMHNKDVIDGSGYLPPNKTNPYFESLGLYHAELLFSVRCIFSPEAIEKYADEVFEQIVEIGQKLAESYGLGNTDFVRGWPCHFRLNKYNFTPQTVGSSGVQMHTDKSFLTILHDDEDVGGLDVLDKSAAFVPVDPFPGSLLVIFGDVAQVWSNGRLRNVKHRVHCSDATIRFSIASFLLGPKEALVEAPPEFVDSEHPRLYVPFTFEDYHKLRISTGLRAGETLELLRKP